MRSVRRSGNRSRHTHHHLRHHRRPLPPPTSAAAAAATTAADATAASATYATATANGVDIALWVIHQDKDMFCGVGVGMGCCGVVGENGGWGTRADTAMPYIVKYL